MTHNLKYLKVQGAQYVGEKWGYQFRSWGYRSFKLACNSRTESSEPSRYL